MTAIQAGTAAVRPAIISVTDASNTPIPNGGSTSDTSITLSGTAEANSVVVIYDGPAFKGSASVVSAGTWAMSISDLAAETHRFTARTPDGTLISDEWVITTGVVVTPITITGVSDSTGPVGEGGTTTDTTVTLSGTAAANEVVAFYQDGALLGDVPVNASSVWTRLVTGLTVSTHNFQVLGRYGSNPVSGIRSLTVLASAVPTIDSIKDSSGTEIPAGGTTSSTSVTLSGTAAASQQVQILDNGVDKGTAQVNGSNAWTWPLNGLGFGTNHSITAKGLYGSEPVSDPRTFNVAVATVPTITSVRDSRGEVVNGGSTTDTAVSLLGKAAASEQVQILDNGSDKTRATANTSGDWNASLAGLGLGGHSITAKGLYGSNPTSTARTFTVEMKIPPLSFDTSPASLSGRVYIFRDHPDVLPNFGSNTSIRRQASGGVPPYTYSSHNAGIAVVDGAGLVTVRANGATSITVRDNAGSTLSFSLNVSGVIKLVGLGGGKWDKMTAAAGSVGGRLASMEELRQIHAEYASRWFMGADYYWSSESNGGVIERYWMKRFPDGVEAHVQWYGIHSGLALL